jgi:hypothetical protein
MPANLALTPPATLVAEATVAAAIATLQGHLVTYETFRLTNWSLCDPEGRIQEIDASLGTAALEDIEALVNEKIALAAGGPQARYNARGKVIAAFADSKAAIIALCQVCEARLSEYRATARAAEDAFFALYGQATARTAVSLRYDSALREVVAMRSGWQGFQCQNSIIPRAEAINIMHYLGASPFGA